LGLEFNGRQQIAFHNHEKIPAFFRSKVSREFKSLSKDDGLFGDSGMLYQQRSDQLFETSHLLATGYGAAGTLVSAAGACSLY
jgi:hypothetical protein